MRSGLIAAGLAVFAAAVLLTGGGRAEGAAIAHTCSATDRQFIRVAELNMVALGVWGENYREGSATAKEVVGEADKAAKRVDRLQPSDPSLKIPAARSRTSRTTSPGSATLPATVYRTS